ncbi:MAG: hypothetical protein JO356_03445 [Acidobacteria bacterium]|nr:hypothetical protein [Acidobacteriota bacterium]
MRTYLGVTLLCGLLVGLPGFAAREESLEQLITRAESAKTDQRPDLYMQVADRLLKSAIESYKNNRRDQFRSVVQDIVKYCDNAHAAAIDSNKHVKRTEIKIRQISTRLRDIKLNVDVDDQNQVQIAIDRLESFRTELLHSMFGTKKQ